MKDAGSLSTLFMQPTLTGLVGLLRRLALEGALSEMDARRYQDEAAKAKKSQYAYLLERRVIEPLTLTAAHAAEFGLAMFDARALDLATAPIKTVSEELIQKHQVLPLMRRGNRLYLGVSDPTNTRAIDEVKFQSSLMIEQVMVEPSTLAAVIEQALSAGNEDLAESLGLSADDTLETLDVGDDEGASDIDGGDDTPIVKFVNRVLVDAIRRGASDIHFEPYETDYRVRFRMDGILNTVTKINVKNHARVAARLKVMAQLDIAEKRVPQDGRIKLNVSKTKQMDFRVSTLPTLFGEKIVLRLLDGGAAKLGIDKLGYEDDQRQLYLSALSKPYGMILVTGPTGSGKTVSLYTGLNILNTDERNISTAEDPVEIRVPGINQVQVNPKKGMTFAAALKSFLRQDPDVIMVGEIRDLETAEIAIKAAQTGHLVLSTLHTNDAPATISRLMNMGVAPYNITSSVTLIIAQRLARRLHDCKVPVEFSDHILLQAGFTQAEIAEGVQVYEAREGGCPDCNDGYKGRTGIYQVLPMLEEIQRIVLQEGNALEIAAAAERMGIADLRRAALNKVKQGLTSLTEADRVTKAE